MRDDICYSAAYQISVAFNLICRNMIRSSVIALPFDVHHNINIIVMIPENNFACRYNFHLSLLRAYFDNSGEVVEEVESSQCGQAERSYQVLPLT